MRVLDSFDDLTPWKVSGSDEVKTRMRKEGGALCMDYDFGKVSGYAVAARDLPIEFPGNYEFVLRLRGQGPPNSLQFKLVDSTGENVWWVNRQDFSLSRDWQEVRFEKGNISFAWGPAADRELKRSARLELVIARGFEGGSGTVCFDRLSFNELPPGGAATAPTLLESPNAYFEALAKNAPRGHYPRGFSGEQGYWTVLGVDGGERQGLLSEDGAIEIGPRSGSIEPFLIADGQLITWADVATEHTLAEGYLPIPTVVWRHRDLVLRVTAYAAGSPSRSQLIADYWIENRSDRPLAVTLALAFRPFQVNPPQQFLNVAGGVARVNELSWDGNALTINGRQRVQALLKPDEAFVAPLESGNIPDMLRRGGHGPTSVRDASGFASAVLIYRIDLPARGARRLGLTSPLAGSPALPDSNALTWLDAQQAATAAEWKEKLNRIALMVPHSAQPLADTLRTALAHILINRGGAALQPGARAYARSWIRDGAMMADELARAGHAAVGRDFAGWFASHQFASGKVPCCVDGRGSDPVAENDSHGEFLYLVARQYRYGRDRKWLTSMWPRVAAAVSYMDSLRRKERTASNRTPERKAYYGLMPPSISHEGYSDRPAYSYWDDFWTLAGYDAAHTIAGALGRSDDVARIARQREEFSRDLQASLRASIARHGIDYLPASADRGDFDATSSTIALSIAGQQADLPQRELANTFERYWKEVLARRSGKDWEVYTPYELRNVGAFVRLGWRERAGQLLEGFLADRRPRGWNQWAEVIGRLEREPRFVGDMPHGWIASDYIRSVLDLFAYERQADRSLVLAAGVPLDWLAGQGTGIRNLRTPYGELSYLLRRDGQRVVLKIEKGLRPPPGGLVFRWPYDTPTGSAVLNGKPVRWEGRELRIRTVPAVIEIKN
ncbi:MAG TPA: hypothetical protein VJQ51_06095 [Burkholderiales bacterium]|nr:hypothetical protein [Burkholderiales bacterium]